MKFEETVSFMLGRLAAHHRKALERAAAVAGLHGGQVFVLMELWKRDGQRQVDLAARLDVSAPTINKILGGLLDGDFVTRARYEDDARSTRIFLTAKGQAVKSRLEDAWVALEEQTTINLTDTEILVLRQLLERLLEPVDI